MRGRARIRCAGRSGASPDSGAAGHRRTAGGRGQLVDTGRVRDLPAGRVAAPARAARVGLRICAGRGHPAVLRRRLRTPARGRCLAGPVPRLLGPAAGRPRNRACAGQAGGPAPAHRQGRAAMSDILDQINDIHREVGRRAVADGEAHAVLLRRTYHAPAEEVWDACTDPERISRWFLPVSGDLKLGGHYQLQGNAGGEILECVPPKRLRVSWVMGDDPGFSEVEVRLTAESAEQTVFELEHVAVVPPEFWDQFGPGAVGVGW